MKLAPILLGSSLFLVLSLMFIPGLDFVQAVGSDPYTFSENSSPYDIPYKNWTAE
jgi:hypothetical protein